MTEQKHILTLDQALSPTITGRMTCRQVLTYFPWLLIGATAEGLESRIVYPLIRHAKKCRDCESWIQNELGFKDADELEKFFRWVWSHRK
jgi:hypothetical protein